PHSSARRARPARHPVRLQAGARRGRPPALRRDGDRRLRLRRRDGVARPAARVPRPRGRGGGGGLRRLPGRSHPVLAPPVSRPRRPPSAAVPAVNPAPPVLALLTAGGAFLRRRELGAPWAVLGLAGIALLAPALALPTGVPSPAATLANLPPWQS